MAQKTLILIAVMLASLTAHAHVTVLSPRWNCEALLLEKSVRGLRLSLEDDPTLQPPAVMSEDAYQLEALTSIESVRNVYAQIFKKLKMSDEESAAILAKFEADDRERTIKGSPAKNGLDNTAYFVAKNRQGQPVSVLRATMIRAGESRRLPLEEKVKVKDGNRVELERAYNARGAHSQIPAREMMMVMADYFKDYFGSSDYTAYALTDKPRAELYRTSYDFTPEEQPQLDPMYRYLVKIKGEWLHFRYVGHIHEAYKLAFQWGPFNKGSAMHLLTEMNNSPGLKDYLFNLIAQSVVAASGQDYEQALGIANRLRAMGHADINEDYANLWEIRILYDPINRKGDGEQALSKLREYLARKPLQTAKYNDRAMLFLVYELKILFGLEHFDQAEALVNKHRELLYEGVSRMNATFAIQWKPMLGYEDIPRLTAAKARRKNIELMWDIGTHADFWSTPVLRPVTYRRMDADSRTLGKPELADHYQRVGEWLVHQGF